MAPNSGEHSWLTFLPDISVKVHSICVFQLCAFHPKDGKTTEKNHQLTFSFYASWYFFFIVLSCVMAIQAIVAKLLAAMISFVNKPS